MIFGFLFVCNRFEKANQQSKAKNIRRDVRLRRDIGAFGGGVNLVSVGSDSDSDSDWDSGEDERDD